MCTGVQQQYSSSSGTTTTVFQALAFVPVTVYARVLGAQQQDEIEPRQKCHAQCNSETHIVGPYARYAKHTAAAEKKQ